MQTIFCGNIKGGITKQYARKQAMRKNPIKVEVMDLNPTRIARMGKRGQSNRIYFIYIYLNLNDAEALKLGYDHNVINDFGKSTPAEHSLLLFRQEMEKLDHIEKTAAKMVTWKDLIKRITLCVSFIALA